MLRPYINPLRPYIAPRVVWRALLRLLLGALFPNAVNPSAHDEYADHCECGSAVSADQGKLARQAARDEHEPDDDAAHPPSEGTGKGPR